MNAANDRSSLFTTDACSDDKVDANAPLCVVEVRNLTFVDAKSEAVILDRVTIDLHQGHRLAILGARKAGRSLLIQLLAGQAQPASGQIIRRGRISFPLGHLPPFCAKVSPIKTCIEQCALGYGGDPNEVINYFEKVCYFGFDPNMQWQRLQPMESRRLGIALGLAIPFDIYLFDDFSPIWMNEDLLRQMFAARKAESSIIFTTRIAACLGDHATHIALIEDGRVAVYDTVREGLLAFRAMTKTLQDASP